MQTCHKEHTSSMKYTLHFWCAVQSLHAGKTETSKPIRQKPLNLPDINTPVKALVQSLISLQVTSKTETTDKNTPVKALVREPCAEPCHSYNL